MKIVIEVRGDEVSVKVGNSIKFVKKIDALNDAVEVEVNDYNKVEVKNLETGEVIDLNVPNGVFGFEERKKPIKRNYPNKKGKTRKYRHTTPEERENIKDLLRKGFTSTQIFNKTGRNWTLITKLKKEILAENE